MVTAPDRRTPAARLVYVNVGGPGQLPHWAAQIETSEARQSDTRNLSLGYAGSWRTHTGGRQWRSTQGEGRWVRWRGPAGTPSHLIIHGWFIYFFTLRLNHKWHLGEEGERILLLICIFEYLHFYTNSILFHFDRVRPWQLQSKLAMLCQFCLYFLCTCYFIHKTGISDGPNTIQETDSLLEWHVE